jgi:hypothetical protein
MLGEEGNGRGKPMPPWHAPANGLGAQGPPIVRAPDSQASHGEGNRPETLRFPGRGRGMMAERRTRCSAMPPHRARPFSAGGPAVPPPRKMRSSAGDRTSLVTGASSQPSHTLAKRLHATTPFRPA